MCRHSVLPVRGEDSIVDVVITKEGVALEAMARVVFTVVPFAVAEGATRKLRMVKVKNKEQQKRSQKVLTPTL